MKQSNPLDFILLNTFLNFTSLKKINNNPKIKIDLLVKELNIPRSDIFKLHKNFSATNMN